MMQPKLNEHELRKGKFVTPFNDLPQMKPLNYYESWTYGSLPEYMWIALILERMGRKEGIVALKHIINKLKSVAPSIRAFKLSSILALKIEIQKEIFIEINNNIPKGTLSPLTLIYTSSQYPEFSKYFYSHELNINERKSIFIKTMNKIMFHKSNEATDIRYIVLLFGVIFDNINIGTEQETRLLLYSQLNHDDDEMRSIRPFIRSCELVIKGETNDLFIDNFWRVISGMSDCEFVGVNFPKEECDVVLYTERLYEVFSYLNDLYKTVKPIDEKMLVILSIATYANKRFKEVVLHDLYNTVSGRSCLRTMIESYIMMKYLLMNESKHDNIWRDYRIYGIGLYKLVLLKYREVGEKLNSHFDVNYIETLVNEFWSEEFTDIDTRYFDKKNIREKSKYVGEQELYGLYYDYDSSFEHGLWGAIRESSLLCCTKPTHQYHSVPDIDDLICLKSVLSDCIMVMNKIIVFLNQLYGIPQELYKEVIGFEL